MITFNPTTEWKGMLRGLRAIAVLYFGMDAFMICGMYFATRGHMSIEQVPREMLAQPHAVILIAGAALWGISRLTARNVATSPRYRRWLTATPWEFGKPLPRGSMLLTPFDALGAAALAAMMRYDARAEWHLPVIGFLGGYLFMALMTVMEMKQGVWAYLTTASLVPIIGSEGNLHLILLELALAYFFAAIGLWRGLRKFPWPIREKTTVQVGWPFQVIAPGVARISVSLRAAIAGSLMIAWLAYFLSSLPFRDDPHHARADLLISAGVFGLAVSLVRLLAYTGRRPPSVSFWGRLLAGPFWMSGYDIVYLAPIGVLLVTALSAGIIYDELLPAQISSALCAGAILATALLAGPSMEKWDLTGHHRLTRVNTPAQRQQRRELAGLSIK